MEYVQKHTTENTFLMFFFICDSFVMVLEFSVMFYCVFQQSCLIVLK